MRGLIFANGQPPSLPFLQALKRDASLVVAADGGARHALGAGFELDAVVGDLDSFPQELRSRIPEGRVHHRPDPDATDLEKAVEFCVSAGCDVTDVVCAGGGRADHALANLAVLPRFRGRARVRLLDDAFTISLVEGTEQVDAPAGTVVSLIAISECRGVTTTGLRWNLANFTLDFSPRGVHNEVQEPPATVSVASGTLLLFRGHWIERHAS